MIVACNGHLLLDDKLLKPRQTGLKFSLKLLWGLYFTHPIVWETIKRIHTDMQSKGVTSFCLFEVEAIQTEIMTNGPVEGIVL